MFHFACNLLVNLKFSAAHTHTRSHVLCNISNIKSANDLYIGIDRRTLKMRTGGDWDVAFVVHRQKLHFKCEVLIISSKHLKQWFACESSEVRNPNTYWSQRKSLNIGDFKIFWRNDKRCIAFIMYFVYFVWLAFSCWKLLSSTNIFRLGVNRRNEKEKKFTNVINVLTNSCMFRALVFIQ